MKYYFLALATIVVVCVGCATAGPGGGKGFDTGPYVAPPAQMMQRPGPMVDGPGPGVLGMMAPPPVRPFAAATTQVQFLNPPGMHIGWQIPTGYAENQIITPGRWNFVQGATYRLKLTNVPGRPGLVLYPTIQFYPAHPTTDAYLSHNSVPIVMTDEDLDQIQANNFVTKVIYLPDPRFQELAIAGVETLVSTTLDPGVDPVAEADRRGTIMVVFRVGNMDFEMPGQPAAVVPGGPVAPVVPAVPGAPVMPGVVPGAPAFPGGPALPQEEGAEGTEGGVDQVSHEQVQYTVPTVNGVPNQIVPPMPIAGMPAGMPYVPGSMIMGQYSVPGQPAPHPIAGMGTIPSWGMPQTGTPIGLVGPPHLPYGGPAGLKSHTVRNQTKVDVGEPVRHFLVDVEHKPGIRLPKPVKYVQYQETHPVYNQGQASYPAWYAGSSPLGPPPPNRKGGYGYGGPGPLAPPAPAYGPPPAGYGMAPIPAYAPPMAAQGPGY